MDFSLLDANGGQGARGLPLPRRRCCGAAAAAAAEGCACCRAFGGGKKGARPPACLSLLRRRRGPGRGRGARGAADQAARWLASPGAWLACSAAHTCNIRPSPPLPSSGWDLAVKLLRPKNKFNRGRLSAAQALRHPFLLLP